MPGHTVTIEGLTISGGFTALGLAAACSMTDATLTLRYCAVQGNNSGGGWGRGHLQFRRERDPDDRQQHRHRQLMAERSAAGGEGGGIYSDGHADDHQ